MDPPVDCEAARGLGSEFEIACQGVFFPRLLIISNSLLIACFSRQQPFRPSLGPICAPRRAKLLRRQYVYSHAFSGSFRTGNYLHTGAMILHIYPTCAPLILHMCALAQLVLSPPVSRTPNGVNSPPSWRAPLFRTMNFLVFGFAFLVFFYIPHPRTIFSSYNWCLDLDSCID